MAVTALHGVLLKASKTATFLGLNVHGMKMENIQAMKTPAANSIKRLRCVFLTP